MIEREQRVAESEQKKREHDKKTERVNDTKNEEENMWGDKKGGNKKSLPPLQINITMRRAYS